MKSVLCYPLYVYVEVLQNHILHANCTQVHKQAPNKMAASAVSMVFYCRRGFGKSLLVSFCFYPELHISDIVISVCVCMHVCPVCSKRSK